MAALFEVQLVADDMLADLSNLRAQVTEAFEEPGRQDLLERLRPFRLILEEIRDVAAALNSEGK